MTHNEYNEIIRHLRIQMKAEERCFMESLKRRYDSMLASFTDARIATLNTEEIQIGDIITNGDRILKVDRINLHHCEAIEDASFLEFSGPAYTRKMQPRKDGKRTFIQQWYGTIPPIIKHHVDSNR